MLRSGSSSRFRTDAADSSRPTAIRRCGHGVATLAQRQRPDDQRHDQRCCDHCELDAQSPIGALLSPQVVGRRQFLTLSKRRTRLDEFELLGRHLIAVGIGQLERRLEA